MATERQKSANRTNALKSTGPKSDEGKRKSARNATSHGLASALDWRDVMAYHRFLLAEAGLPEDAGLEDPLAAATLALAEAETRVARARDREEEYLSDVAEDKDLTPYLMWARKTRIEITRRVDGVSAEVAELLLASRRLKSYDVRHLRAEFWTAPHRRHQQFVKYRRAAEVARHKALCAWLDLRKESSERSELQP